MKLEDKLGKNFQLVSNLLQMNFIVTFNKLENEKLYKKSKTLKELIDNCLELTKANS